MNLRKNSRKKKYNKKIRSIKHIRKNNISKLKKHTSNKNSKKHTRNKNLKKHTRNKSRKIMRGGIASFPSYPGQVSSNSNLKGVAIDNTHFRQSSYNDSDTPFFPKNVIPQPLNQLKWTWQSGLNNFFNELFGQPKQLSASPTDQPISKSNLPTITNPISTTDLNSIRSNIIKLYKTNE